MKAFIKKKINFIRGLQLLLSLKYCKLKHIRESEIVFFFPYYHTGGGERVHLDIVRALQSKKCCVIFTHASATENFLKSFKEVAFVVELNSIRNKKHEVISKKLDALIINEFNQSTTIKKVFGCNTNYFYKLLPHFNAGIEKIDLIHALEENDERFNVLAMSASLIDNRVVINKKAKEDVKNIYHNFTVSSKYINNINIISNGINLPREKKIFKRKNNDPIIIGFIGRWSKEKRPKLFLDMAKSIQKSHSKLKIVMAGTGMKANLDEINKAKVCFLGEITCEKEMINLYKSLSLIVICSKYEGFPMVLMESMPYGVVPICTNVGGISEHITSGYNGLLINEEDEDDILSNLIKNIKILIEDREQLYELSKNASLYATEHFSIDKFNKLYFNLLA